MANPRTWGGILRTGVLAGAFLVSSVAMAGAKHTGSPKLTLSNESPGEVMCWVVAPNRSDRRKWNYAGVKLTARAKDRRNKPGTKSIAEYRNFDDRSLVCFHTANWKSKNPHKRPWPGQQKIGDDWYVWTGKIGNAGDHDTVHVACRGAQLSCGDPRIERNTH